MADAAWPPLLAALSLCLAANLSESIFAEVLTAFQDFTICCGLLGLDASRDAFLSTLGKYAVPPPVVSAMQHYADGRGQPSTGAEALGLSSLTGSSGAPPSLSERNLACLKSVITIGRVLSTSLRGAWHDVLETLQNANFLMSKRPGPSRRPTGASPNPGVASSGPKSSFDAGGDRSGAFNDLDIESIHANINVLFDGTKDMDDPAFTSFVNALCQLSSEMIGVQSDFSDSSADLLGSTSTLMSPPATPKSPNFMGVPVENRRRASGIQIMNSMKSGERSFSLTKLRTVAMINLPRLVNSDPTVGWNAITHHLSSIARHPTAPSNIRLQAADTLGELLLSAMRVGKEAKIQHLVFEVLVRQVNAHPVSNTLSVDYDVRSGGYQLLNQILESSGHSLEVGWSTIFNMLESVCHPSGMKRSDSQTSFMSTQNSTRPAASTKGDANLVRIAFPSLNLICTDFLSSLESDDMRRCISCLASFGKQQEDVNIALASIGLLWTLSDSVQGTSKDLWLYLLTEMLELGRDSRLEVRCGAMQTLFRCIEIYGSSLDAELWGGVLDKVVFPLLDTIQADESQILALSSAGSIFSLFLPQLSELSAYEQVYTRLLDKFQWSFSCQPRNCATAALKALEKILLAVRELSINNGTKADMAANRAWTVFVDMSKSLTGSETYTQENLVAYVRIAQLLHNQLEWTELTSRQLSDILRLVMNYTRSPEYRPDIDSMSPLQQSIAELLASSSKLSPNIILSDLSEFSSLAYAAESASSGSGKLTYVALSKYCMPKISSVFTRNANSEDIYIDGTVESVLGSLAIPIKLKYDCPPSNKFGNDPPLWRTASKAALPIITGCLDQINRTEISQEKIDSVWTIIVDIFGGALLADASNDIDNLEDDENFVLAILMGMKASILPYLGNDRVSERIRNQFAEILRKGSLLYRYDVRNQGGTTAPVIPENQEKTRYWAFDLLIDLSRKSDKSVDKVKEKETEDVTIARACISSLMRRIKEALRGILDDANLRGQMPFPR